MLAGAGWMLRDRWSGGSPAPARRPGRRSRSRSCRSATRPGDPTLDSLGSSLSQVLGTELGQSSRVRTVPSDRLHQVLQDLQIAPNATLAPQELARVADFTNARRVLWGQYSRFGDAIRIDATLQDLDGGQSVPLNAMAANEASLLDRDRPADRRGAREPGARIAGHAERAQGDVVEAVDELVRRAAPLQRRRAADAAGHPSGRAEELRGRDEGRTATSRWPTRRLARAYSTLGYDNEAVQNSQPRDELERRAAAAGEIPHCRQPLPDRERHGQGDRGVREPRQGLAQQRDRAVRSRRAVRAERRPRQGTRALREGRRARSEVRRGTARARARRDQARQRAGRTRAAQYRADARDSTQQRRGARRTSCRPSASPTSSSTARTRRSSNYQESLEIKQRLGNKRGMAEQPRARSRRSRSGTAN